MNREVAAAVACCAPEILLWGADGEAGFDGYSRQAVAWSPTDDGCLEGAPVEWIVAGPGGPAITGWGVMVDGKMARASFGETWTPTAGDVISVTPRITLEFIAAVR